MNKKELRKLEKIITKSCNHLISLGGKIICGGFFDKNNPMHCCPIRATILFPPSKSIFRMRSKIPSIDPYQKLNGYADYFSKSIGLYIFTEECQALSMGFDDCPIYVRDKEIGAFFDLGQRLRKQFNPTSIIEQGDK
jgi:hypothetical protein